MQAICSREGGYVCARREERLGVPVDVSESFHLIPEASGMARQSLDCFAEILSRERLDDIRLVVSELVTNAVQHSGLGEGEWVNLKVEQDRGGVRVEVTDWGCGFSDGSRRPNRHGGRVLAIVERLSGRWGHHQGAKTVVWAEFALP
jgi:anti-sigma regulatory factor (Ser/Thr protein kinase)